jgi:metallo-beta-lactamase family protein
MLGDKRHNVLFVGYQARGTPGRVIQRYGPQGGYVEFDGERIDIRAGIETVAGYSAHADQRGLLSFVTGMRRWPSEIRVVHGDAEARSALVDVLQSRYSARGLPVRILGGSA